MALASCTNQLVGRRVGASGKLAKRQGRDRDFGWKQLGIKVADIHRNRCIDQSSIFSQPSSEA